MAALRRQLPGPFRCFLAGCLAHHSLHYCQCTLPTQQGKAGRPANASYPSESLHLNWVILLRDLVGVFIHQSGRSVHCNGSQGHIRGDVSVGRVLFA